MLLCIHRTLHPNVIFTSQVTVMLTFYVFCISTPFFTLYLQVNVSDVWRLPGNVNVKDAAVLAYGHSMAVYAFSNLCKPTEGHNVIISAGPAGLGLAAVDVAANVYKSKVSTLI